MLAINCDPESAFFPIIIMQTEIGESGRFPAYAGKRAGRAFVHQLQSV